MNGITGILVASCEPMQFESLPLRFDEIFKRESLRKKGSVSIIGSANPVMLSDIIVNSISSDIKNLPRLVVCPSIQDAHRISQAVAFFSPHSICRVLPDWDVSPYQGLYPRPQNTHERISFLNALLDPKPGEIFIAPIMALLQKTLPFEMFMKSRLTLKVGDEFPAEFVQQLSLLGYQAASYVEDCGQFAQRGGILDVFSPAHSSPVRFELFGDTIESIRLFSVSDQRSQSDLKQAVIVTASEIIWETDSLEEVLARYRDSLADLKNLPHEAEELLRTLSRMGRPQGIEFLLPYFYKKPGTVLDYICTDFSVWNSDQIGVDRHAESALQELKADQQAATASPIQAEADELFLRLEDLRFPESFPQFQLSEIELAGSDNIIPYTSQKVLDLQSAAQGAVVGSSEWSSRLREKLSAWKNDHFDLFISTKSRSQADRIQAFLEKMGFEPIILGQDQFSWHSWHEAQRSNDRLIHIIPRPISESMKSTEDRRIFLRDEDLFGKKFKARATSSVDEFHKKARIMSFGELKPGHSVVHVQHGIGIYEGLKVMDINGAPSEFLQIAYKDKDKLYLPVYRIGQIQKYAGAAGTVALDKLGGTSWERTKIKVRAHLRDIASELLKIYAARAESRRPSFVTDSPELLSFESQFEYEETQDQLRAIDDIKKDLGSEKPMDRLVCGDVGFGKTEVAMRAAFLAAQNGKQVVVLAPTTVLTFQHLETFKKRFAGFPFEIRALNRFVSSSEVKKTLQDLRSGAVHILIGTHRVLSKDVEFKDLGLLIVDEEQRFGVAHKERIRKIKMNVDTLAMSATPIPRTLNMSLVGIRDLSLINTAPVDRLPTRTFVCKFDPSTIRKAIKAEMDRGGQVYFIHNRIQSIYGLADELRQIIPEARMKIGHGQMDEEELEKTMVSFFHHEIDVLICTTIVESGMDVPRANTMFIDQAQMMGLSQLYQLRGRVGRSKQRAYCYLMVPNEKNLDKDAQERLKVIQQNTALGSGITVAQYDLELRGTGNILGDDQSGHVNAVGYELYMDLLNDAISTAKGQPTEDRELEPEINLRIPALIPDSYISDIRIRLSYYKALTEIDGPEDIDRMEVELKDQFGEIPQETLNLMGLMLIRLQCKRLGVRDVSAGLKNVSLIFTPQTKLKPEVAIGLASKENKKYSLTPDNRLNIRLNSITWPNVYEELGLLLRMI